MDDLKKNTVYTVTIDGYASGGDGVARLDGRVLFIKGALMGETCRVKVMKDAGKIVYARLEEVVTPSPSRREPACPYFDKCGGCDLWHMDYAEELRFKRRRVEDALARIGGLDIPLNGIVGAETTARYRNKAIYAVGTADGRAAAGFYRAHSHALVPIESCLIQADAADRASAAVRRWMDRYTVPAYDEEQRTGMIRHVFCRYAFSTGEAQVTVVSNSRRLPHPNALIDEIRRHCPETASIILNVNKTHGNTVLAGEFLTLWGEDVITDVLCGLTFKLSPRSFYQINPPQAERLYAKAAEYAALNRTQTVLDLYCGTGTITLIMAQKAGRAIGVEVVEAAVSDARENAELNGASNVEFLCADARLAAADLKKRGITPDVVIVDPPRKGLLPGVVDTIAGLSPARVVYVSCEPSTLARDLKLFDALGYKADEATAFDMFPRCAHVETVVLLKRDN